MAKTSIEISPQPVTFKTKTYYMSFQAPKRGIECLTAFKGNRVIHKRCAGQKDTHKLTNPEGEYDTAYLL